MKKCVFGGILDYLEAALVPWACVRFIRGVVRGLVPGRGGSPRSGPVPVPVRVKIISFVSKKGAKNIFCVEKMCQDVQPMFRRRISR